MSDPERDPEQPREGLPPSSQDRPLSHEGEDEEERDDAPSPLDHPAFMPVILWGAALYFGYDGWITQDPDLLDDRTFNRVGCGVLLLLALYFTVQNLRGARASGGDES